MKQIALIRIPFCVLACVSLSSASENIGEHSLWEVGLAAATAYAPDYPAADHSRLKWVVAPYGIYRGKILQADRDGARARLLHARYYEMDLAAAASLATHSKDNPARVGMPDLDYLLELGPRLIFPLMKLGDKGKLQLFIPVRAVFSTDFSNFHHRGFTMAPSLNARCPLPSTNLWAVSQLTANFANRQMSAYFYDVAPEFARPDRPFYDAHAGYIGSDLFGGLIIPLGRRVRLFTGAQALVHSGAANESSPLFKREFNYTLIAGFIWTFYRSSKQAPLID